MIHLSFAPTLSNMVIFNNRGDNNTFTKENTLTAGQCKRSTPNHLIERLTVSEVILIICRDSINREQFRYLRGLGLMSDSMMLHYIKRWIGKE